MNDTEDDRGERMGRVRERNIYKRFRKRWPHSNGEGKNLSYRSIKVRWTWKPAFFRGHRDSGKDCLQPKNE